MTELRSSLFEAGGISRRNVLKGRAQKYSHAGAKDHATLSAAQIKINFRCIEVADHGGKANGPEKQI